MKKPIVIYHGTCADGFSAAWVFWQQYKDEYEYFAGVYGKPHPDVTDRDVYLVDFSYKRNIIEQMISVAKSVTLIDHHKTAIDDLKDLPGLEQFVSLDMSGATLAWKFVHPTLDVSERPLLLGHIEDNDLWRFKLPSTKEIQSYVYSQDYDFEQWDRMMNADQVELMKMTVAGAAINRKHQKDVKELIKICQREMTVAGFTVPSASLPYTMASDAAGTMAVGHPFAVCYYDTQDSRVFSLRSTENGEDVSLIAQQYGGGGHKHASGFRVPRDHILATS